ncbi:putative phosphoribosyl transferase [Devosia sp. LC5]|uniref:phosphoribosyltransferase n=1 Tax=Devosia sp. LC5 TaxID=1502724 RepID=UPI0004E40BE3|nr:phosphoribosyltransferase [Devosia sp. LC5]KFC69533.1 putative phosphoribosyl transferase [Devosia sp. LC5]
MITRSPLFADRQDAGRQLAKAVAALNPEHPLVLALPRGGVPVAVEIARALHAPLDLVLVRKIGAPGHEEYGLGAVIDGNAPQIVLNDEIMRLVNPPAGYVERQAHDELKELERRRKVYLGSRPPIPLVKRTVIVVDDGIATGVTMTAALKGLKRTGAAARLILAVPTAPLDVIEALKPEVDDIVCLTTPEPFRAVGLHYADFSQVSDGEVVTLLKEAELWV